MKICRWCKVPIPGTTDTSPNWMCQKCLRFDADRCLACGKTEGFPLQVPWLDGEARRGVFVKQYVYCEWCLHGAYFVTQNGPASRCSICNTEWDRLKSAVHAPTVAMRA